MSRLLSTSDVASSQRLDYWNSILENEFPGMSVSAARNISASWKTRTIGAFRVMRINSQKARIHRWQSTTPDPEYGRSIAHIVSEGTCLAFREDAAGLINTGDLAIGAAGAPYGLNISDRNVAITIEFPTNLLSINIPAEGRLIARSESVKRLHDFALTVLDDEFNVFHDEENAEECISGVFSALLHTCAENTAAAMDDDVFLCSRILEFVENSLRDNTLRTNMIARHLSVSRRQVQRIFAMLGVTPSQYILTRRANLAAFMLRSPSFGGTVTDIAMEAGFSDAAHFCHSFRRIFGVTPTEYARLHRDN
ncbi:helix-turn-helix transcriptional regulator [Hyphococcus luteus]|nr:AraC family transcriptional regulator [Marinicaulis flavus]